MFISCSNIAFGADGRLAKTNGVLCWFLLQIGWIVILTITWSYLTKVIFYTILVAGLIMDCGNCACFTATMEPKPRHIDCKSNHSLEETNWLLFSELSLLQSFINLWNWLSCPRRGSEFDLITSLSLKRLTSLDVWTNNDIVLSRWELSFPCPIMFSWYFCWNNHHRRKNLQIFINWKHWYNNILTS